MFRVKYFFHISSYLGSKWRNRLIPQLRVSSDLMGYTGESVQTPGKPRQAKKIILSSSNKKEIELISRYLELNRLSLRQITE